MVPRRYAVVAAVLLSLVAVAPVQAADPARVYNKVVNSTNPEATYKSLTREQKDALKKYLKVDRIVTERSGTLMQTDLGNNCTEAGFVIRGRNFLGVTLWKWNMYAEWCMDSTRQRYTYTYSRVYGRTEAYFWSWRTVEHHKTINTTVNPDRFRVFGQGEFKQCLFADIGCTTYVYPTIQLTAWGLGSSNHSWRWWV